MNLRFKDVPLIQIQDRVHELLIHHPKLAKEFDSFLPSMRNEHVDLSNELSTALYVMDEEEDSCKTMILDDHTVSLPIPSTTVQIVDETTTLLPSASSPPSSINWTRGLLWSISLLVCLMFIFGLFSWNYFYIYHSL